MTTFSCTLILDDTERVELEAALGLLKEECERQIARQRGAPYLAWHRATASIKNKIDAGVQHVSTNTFNAGFS